MASPHYRHRQLGTMFMIPIGVILLAYMLFVFIVQERTLIGIPVILGLGLIYSAFAAITTTVDRKHVHVSWTWGWPARRIPLKAIASHEQVRSRWWHGFGVRLIPGGMLYSLQGLDAVEIRYRDAKKGKDRMLRIGTDDPAGLVEAITRANAPSR
ncbi:MAG: hypothetical protein AAGE98_05210 [Actinomycetota bacterium]